jgi:hypothetical protein
MSIKRALDNILEGNLDEMRQNFSSALTTKSVEKLEERKIEIAKNYFGQMQEEVEQVEEDWDSEKLEKGKKIERAAKTIRANRQDNIKSFAGEIAKRHKDDAVTGGNSADDAEKAMKQLYGKNKGDRKAIKKISRV